MVTALTGSMATFFVAWAGLADQPAGDAVELPRGSEVSLTRVAPVPSDTPHEVAAQQQKIWVFFSDKGIESREAYERAIAQVAHDYNARAVARRRLRRSAPGLFDMRDLPIVNEYLEAVLATGARLGVASRWLNAISVTATPAQREAITEMPFVDSTGPVLRGRRDDPSQVGLARVPQGEGPDPSGFYGRSEEQITQITLDAMHQAGFTGRDVIIGVLDTGFKRTHDAFNDPDHPLQVVAEWDFVKNDPNTAPEEGDPPNQHHHGTWILGVLGAYKPGELVGAAYDASFILAKVEDAEREYPLEEDWFVAGLEFIEAKGGDIATSSLTAYWYQPHQMDGKTSVMARGFNIATANGLHCTQGAGNSGHDNDPRTNHLVTPADAFDVIAVGAVDVDGNIAGFSSDGPTVDGRTKPEVLARGAATWTVSVNNNTNYTTKSGTSLSTPVAGSAVACLVQAHPDWTVEQMRASLFSTGTYYQQNHAFDPLYIHGFGLVDTFGAHSVSLCTAQEFLKVRCHNRKGESKVRARMKKGQPHVIVTFRLDEDNDTDIETDTNRRGRARVTYQDLAQGPHTVEVLQCDLLGEAECR